MKNLSLTFLGLAVVWLFYLRIVYSNKGFDKLFWQEWTKLTLSYFTLAALTIAGIFGFIKYNDYRKENNYQKVMERYLEGNIEFFTSELSKYSALASLNLQRFANPSTNLEEKQKLTREVIDASLTSLSSAHKLMVFDESIYQCYIGMHNTIFTALNYSTRQDAVPEDIRTLDFLIQEMSQFIALNFQEVCELIRENPEDYDKPTLDVIKNKDRYKNIIKRIDGFKILLDEKNKAHQELNNFRKEKNKLKISNPTEFNEKDKIFSDKFSLAEVKLHQYIAVYLKERGLVALKIERKKIIEEE